MPVVRSVCLFNFFFLLLFSNKMKSLFLFYRGTVLSHTAKYRMNDVTMIYSPLNTYFIYLFKNFVSIVMNYQ